MRPAAHLEYHPGGFRQGQWPSTDGQGVTNDDTKEVTREATDGEREAGSGMQWPRAKNPMSEDTRGMLLSCGRQL